ncbi:Ig-like domain-containing protein, partial [Congregibacter sp.]
INISAETRAAFDGYVDSDTGEQLNLMNSWKNQVSDALAHVGIEFTRESEVDPDGQAPFNNVFESQAIDHVIDTIRDDAVGGDREPGAFDQRLSDVIEADGGVITYFSNQIDMSDPGARSIGFSAEGLLANAKPQQANLQGLEIEIAPGTAAFITRADGSKVQAGTIVYDDDTRTGSIELDSGVISNADVAAGVLQTLEFGYTIWDWTANITVQVRPLDLFKAQIIADPGDVPEDSQYNQFAMTHSLVGDIKAEDGSFFQSDIFTTDQELTFKFTPEVFGPYAEYADDFLVPVEYSTDGGATWQVMPQVGTYQLPEYQPVLPIFALNWSAGVEEILVRIPIFDDPIDEQPNSDGPGGQGIEIIDITAEGENFFTENLQPGIIDNDPSSDLPRVDIDFVIVGEGDGEAILTLSLDRPAVGDVSIDWSAAGLGAVVGEDFEGVSGTAVIVEGETSVQVRVPIIDDLVVEETEFALVNLTGVSSNAVIVDPQGTIRILDNDGLSSTFSIADVAVPEGDEAVVTITRTGDASLQQAVSIASMALAAGIDSASADDFTALGLTTVFFAAGQQTATVRIPTSDDALDEVNETFRVELTNPTNGSAIDASAQVATVTILDNEGAPSFSIDDVSVSEGGLATITVTRSGDAQNTQTVDIATALGGSDTAEVDDFTANSATLTFAQGVTSQTFTVQTTADDVFEGPETLSALLSNATGGATISDDRGVVSILDDGTGPDPDGPDGPDTPDDDTPTLSISGPTTIDEDAGTATYTVTLSNASTGQVSVDYATSDGTAVAGSDYTATNGTLVFAADETSKQVTVSITDDTMDEVDETFSIGLSNLVGEATLGTDSAGTTIVDNDPAPNVAPESEAKTLTVAEDTSDNAVPTLTGSDTDGTVDSFVITGLPANGTLLLSGAAVIVGQNIPAADAGSLTYTPNADYFGDDSFSYASVDDDGAQDGTPASVAITVTDVAEPNVAPESDAKTLTVAEDTTANAVPTLTGSDSDGTIESFVITALPTNGTLLLGSVAVTAGQTIPAADAGNLTYTPNADYFGDDSFSYASVDDDGAQDGTPASVAITVNPENDPPVAVIDAATTNEDTAVDIDVLDNDSDPDGGTLSVVPDGFTQPSNGTVTVNPDGTVKYTPNAGYSGPDSFTYTVSDGQGGTDMAAVNLTVDPAPRLYEIILGAYQDEGSAATWSNTDSNGQTVSITAFQADGSSGTVGINSSDFKLGVSEAARGDNNVPEQLEYNAVTGGSEALVFSFSGYLDQASVSVSNLIPDEGNG